MNRQEIAPRTANTEAVQIVEPAPDRDEETHVNPLLVMHGLLRGRYAIAITLAVIGIVAGGLAGYRIKTPAYRSTGMIRVKPIIDRILYKNEDNGVLPMFDAFVETQMALITSQRVIDQAMQADEWKALGRGLTPDAVAEFTESVEAVRPRGSEMIFVNFSDEDPKAAMAGTKAVVGAYMALYGENRTEADAIKLQRLDEMRTVASAERKNFEDAIRKLAPEGEESLKRRHDGGWVHLQRAEEESNQNELALAVAQSRASGATGATTQPANLTPQQLALNVPPLQKLLDQQATLRRQMETSKFRLGDKHPVIVEATRQLKLIEKEVDEFAELYRLAGPAGVPATPGAPVVTVEQLQAESQRLKQIVAQRDAEVRSMGSAETRIADLRIDSSKVDEKLRLIQSEIEKLTVESPMSGRMDVISAGDPPLQPFNDKRKQFAAVGALVLGGIGLGCVLLYGLLDRRVRNIADAQDTCSRGQRVLGVLPTLPGDFSDPDQAELAAHSVHHIRAQLQMGLVGEGCRALAITSPSPGAGKTSLSCALGLSFAASGSRTLLIDCDIVGGGLTARMDKVIRRKIGQMLRRSGLIDDEQVQTVLRRAEATNQRFGTAAVALGLVEQVDVQHALGAQDDSIVGLREVLAGEHVMDCVTGSGTPGLFVLPLGSAGRQHVGQLSERSIRKIVDEARQHFDMIIIDTGPILGSLEASVVAMAVDQVVLAVSRGEDRWLVERSIEHLRTHGAGVAGIVFNRAHHEDILTSGYSSSISLRPTQVRRQLPFDPESIGSVSRLGPLASAVYAATDMTEGEAN